MPRYADVTVRVEGSVVYSEHATDAESLSAWLHRVANEATQHGRHTEVYVQWHEHVPLLDGCFCHEYITTHQPYIEFNNEEGAHALRSG